VHVLHLLIGYAFDYLMVYVLD